MSIQDPIAFKIKRMLDAANDKSVQTTADRETVVREATSLLVKHHEIQESSPDEKEDREDMDIAEEFPDPFRRILANMSANACFCKFFSTKVPNKQKYKFTFVGLETNVSAARQMAQYLIRSINLEATKQREQLNESIAYFTEFRNQEAARLASLAQQLVNSESAIAQISSQEEAANDRYIKTILGVTITMKKNLPENKAA